MVDINNDLDVDGHTELDNLNVSGISTFQNNLFLTGTGKLGIGVTDAQAEIHVYGSPGALFENSTGNNITVRTHVGNGNDAHINIDKSRGGGGVATTSLNGDNLGTLSFRGYTANGDYSPGAQIRIAQVGDAGSDFIGGRINFRTTNTDGTERTAIVIDPDQLVKIINNDLYVENNLGIGTTAPATDLQVVSYGDHGKIRVESSGNGNRAGIEFFRESSAGIGKGGAGIWVESETGNSSGELRFGTASNASLQSFSTKMLLDSNGNLGIGAESPDTLLHLQGDTPKLRIESTNSLDTSVGTEEIGRIDFEAKKSSNLNVAASLRVRQDGTWSTVTPWFSPTAIEFYTQDQSGTQITSPRFTINNLGNVGIGSTIPTAKLEVVGKAICGVVSDKTNYSNVLNTATNTGTADSEL